MDTTPVTPTPSAIENNNKCGPLGCGKCLQGGIPLRREWVSFWMIVFMVASVVLFTFYVNAKRETLMLQKQSSTVQSAKLSPSAEPLPQTKPRVYASPILLPKARLVGGMPLYQAIAERRSRREFSEEKVTLSQLSQMVFSGQGMVNPADSKRTTPSARESYPMTLYIVVRSVEGLEPGVYEYLPKTHALGKLADVDLTVATKDSGVQEGAQKAPVVFFVSAAIGNYQAKTKSLTSSATYMEAGHIGQNLYLTGESLQMATVVMAGFDSGKVTTAFGLDPAETVEYVVPFGHRVAESTIKE